MGAAFEVYNDRGYGLGEELYQECFEIELELRGIRLPRSKNCGAFIRAANSKGVTSPTFSFSTASSSN